MIPVIGKYVLMVAHRPLKIATACLNCQLVAQIDYWKWNYILVTFFLLHCHVVLWAQKFKFWKLLYIIGDRSRISWREWVPTLSWRGVGAHPIGGLMWWLCRKLLCKNIIIWMFREGCMLGVPLDPLRLIDIESGHLILEAVAWVGYLDWFLSTYSV